MRSGRSSCISTKPSGQSRRDSGGGRRLISEGHPRLFRGGSERDRLRDAYLAAPKECLGKGVWKQGRWYVVMVRRWALKATGVGSSFRASRCQSPSPCGLKPRGAGMDAGWSPVAAPADCESKLLDEAIYCPVGHRCLMCYLLENKADGRQKESRREACLPQLLSSLLQPLMNLLGRTAFKIRRLQGVTCHTFG